MDIEKPWEDPWLKKYSMFTSLSTLTRLADGFGSKSNPTLMKAIHPKKVVPPFP
jgi:hypothetical protein